MQIFKCIFVNEKVIIMIQISLKFVPNDPTNITSTNAEQVLWCSKAPLSSHGLSGHDVHNNHI